MDIAIWGTGKKCKELLDHLRYCNIVAFIESQPQYEKFRGIEVCSAEQLMKITFDLLLVSVVNSADIEKKLYESYSSILHKCVFLSLENIKNVHYFFYQYRLVNAIIDRKYLLECCGGSLELLQYDYKIMQFREDLNSQEKELLYYAQKKGFLQKLNYSFTEKYLDCTYNIQKAQNGMYYVRYLERDVYFPRSWNRKKILCYWCNCMMEDDGESPLRCEIDKVNTEGVIIEIEEGVPIWTIKNLPICKKAYIINKSKEWQEALELTFMDSLDKCHVIEEIAAVTEQQVNCCKIREKVNLLKSVHDLLSHYIVNKFIISVFYHEDDLEIIDQTLLNSNYKNTLIDGYVYYPYNMDIIGKAEFRSGVLIGHRVEKENKNDKDQVGNLRYL